MPTLTIKNYARYMHALANDFKPTVQRGLKSGAERALNVVREAVRAAPPASANGQRGAFDTGDYLRRWKYEIITAGVAFYNEHSAAAVIEYGRRPGARQPPTKPLERWAKRRLGVDDKTARSIAFVVARAIGKRGLRARYVLKDAEPAMADAIEKEIDFELAKMLERGGHV